jgi:hypothetical protein
LVTGKDLKSTATKVKISGEKLTVEETAADDDESRLIPNFATLPRKRDY